VCPLAVDADGCDGGFPGTVGELVVAIVVIVVVAIVVVVLVVVVLMLVSASMFPLDCRAEKPWVAVRPLTASLSA
jgi:hypothetical protein